MALEIFIDESGYTGENQLDPAQPIFVLSSINLGDEVTADLLAEHFSGVQAKEMLPEELDFAGIRDQAIPLPSSVDSNYRRVLLLGTTGAGKTTLVRQLIGTDPDSERFPSTSTAKTTVHDTEIVLRDSGPYRAVVTFVTADEVREYLKECMSAAVLAAYRDADDPEVLRRLLTHVNQRWWMPDRR